ncbi:hypothetical protein JL09_g6613, partial [Pichia kudriavzevii]
KDNALIRIKIPNLTISSKWVE